MITAENVHDLFEYRDGKLFWKITVNNRALALVIKTALRVIVALPTPRKVDGAQNCVPDAPR